jgi:hypothetical protein
VRGKSDSFVEEENPLVILAWLKIKDISWNRLDGFVHNNPRDCDWLAIALGT